MMMTLRSLSQAAMLAALNAASSAEVRLVERVIYLSAVEAIASDELKIPDLPLASPCSVQLLQLAQ